MRATQIISTKNLTSSLFKIFIICIFIFLGCLSFTQNEPQQNQELSGDRINFLWNATIHRMLQDPLWKERDAYDAGHFLMIPLHAAFILRDQSKINDFHQFFDRFVKNYKKDDFTSLGTLTRLHFLYLASEYLVLTKTYKEALPDKLLSIVIDSIKTIWYQPAWQWKVCRSPDFQNMLERIKWKLENRIVPYSYCRAIIDEELFTFAVAADLKTILSNKSPEFINEILDNAYKVFKQEVVFENNNSNQWLFQPGVWTDHPDYAYAGYDKIELNLDKKPVPGIAWDTSHSHRFPLWLFSLEKAYSQEEPQKAQFFKKLRKGLSDQFFEKVLVPPSDEFPNYRTKNFMDGNNGIYRYGYVTQGKGRGYGPYELSGTMLLGWWSFLPKKSIRDVYCYISSRFPLSEKEIKLYLGPDTTRDRHPLIKGRAQYDSGILELIDRLSCELDFSEVWKR